MEGKGARCLNVVVKVKDKGGRRVFIELFTFMNTFNAWGGIIIALASQGRYVRDWQLGAKGEKESMQTGTATILASESTKC